MTHTLPHTWNVLGVTVYYTGHPTTRRWYTDGSKHHGRAGGGHQQRGFLCNLPGTALSRCIGQKPWRVPWLRT